MSDVLTALGLSAEDFEWQDLASCDGLPTNLFFDDYEADPQIALSVDEGCLSCPVMKQCLQYGIENAQWGCWGGVWLSAGKVDKTKNAHKSSATWERVREALS